MKKMILIYLTFFIFSCENDWQETVKKEVAEAEKRYADMEANGQVQEQFKMLAEGYKYIDSSGKHIVKEQLKDRRASDHRIPFKNIASDLDVQPLTKTLAIARGKWATSARYYGGLMRVDKASYMAIWTKENGVWKILADQVTPIIAESAYDKEVIDIKESKLKSYVGLYQLNIESQLKIKINKTDDGLNFTIPNHLDEGLKLQPYKTDGFFTEKRPWQIHFKKDSIKVVTWGQIAKGVKIK